MKEIQPLVPDPRLPPGSGLVAWRNFLNTNKPFAFGGGLGGQGMIQLAHVAQAAREQHLPHPSYRIVGRDLLTLAIRDGVWR